MISVAMATYNGEKYIEDQLDSILGQTYQNFELIICDDCSTDLTWTILQNYEQKDKRIHCFLNELNLGVNKNFEKTIKLCNGDYIAFSDQDDIWLPIHLEVLLNNIQDNFVCCGDAFIFNTTNDNSDDILLSSLNGDASIINNSKKTLIHLLFRGSFYPGCLMLADKRFCLEATPIPDDVKFHDFWLSLCACVLNSFIYTPMPITKYRRHSANVSALSGKGNGVNLSLKLMKKSNFNKNILYNDRSRICQYLLKRYDNIDPETKKLLIFTKEYYENRHDHLYRLKVISFWITNFQFIYLTKSRRIFFLRLLQYLFF